MQIQPTKRKRKSKTTENLIDIYKPQDARAIQFIKNTNGKDFFIGVDEKLGKQFQKNDVVCVNFAGGRAKALAVIENPLHFTIKHNNRVYAIYEQRKGAYFTNLRIPNPAVKERFTYAMARNNPPNIGDILTVRSKKNRALDAFRVAKVSPMTEDQLKSIRHRKNEDPLFLIERSTERFEEIPTHFTYKITIQTFITLMQRKFGEYKKKFFGKKEKTFQKPNFSHPFHDNKMSSNKDQYPKTKFNAYPIGQSKHPDSILDKRPFDNSPHSFSQKPYVKKNYDNNSQIKSSSYPEYKDNRFKDRNYNQEGYNKSKDVHPVNGYRQFKENSISAKSYMKRNEQEDQGSTHQGTYTVHFDGKKRFSKDRK